MITSSPMKASMLFDSGIPGPTVLVLGGVHGDERGGIKLVRDLLSGKNIPAITKGKLIAALGNLAAIAADKRCLEHNMNRAFINAPDIACACVECSRAKELTTLLDEADILLDLHASFTPGTQPFLICERNALPYVGAMDMPNVCFGFDAVQPGGTDYYANRIGKVGICVECGYLSEKAGVSIASNALASLLATMDMVGMPKPMVEKRCFQATCQYVSKENFTLRKPFEDFEAVKKGDVIGRDGHAEIRAPENGYVLFACNQREPRKESFVFLRDT